jgi:hypothetical protein
MSLPNTGRALKNWENVTGSLAYCPCRTDESGTLLRRKRRKQKANADFMSLLPLLIVPLPSLRHCK